MKKLFVILAAAMMTAAIASAQDTMATASEKYNAGLEQFNAGDKLAALDSFKEALRISEALGSEGEALAANCKKAIPGLLLSLAKQCNNEKKFADAVKYAEEAAKTAESYEDFDTLGAANELLPTLKVSEAYFDADNLLEAKDFAAAAEGYKKVLELDPSHANAALRLVQAYTEAGDIDNAKASLETAKALGKEADANKIIGKAYLKKASAALKAKNFSAALTNAQSASEFIQEGNVYLIAGQAASKMPGKENLAIENFSKYLEVSPKAKNAGPIAYTVGALYQQQKNNAKALEFYKKAESLGYAQAGEMIKALSK